MSLCTGQPLAARGLCPTGAPTKMVWCLAHTSQAQGQPCHTTQPLFPISPSTQGCSYLTAMSPSRAQHVLWICDVALCTYVRCSHDSKSSPHPPSSICLARRNWQAWTTSWHAALRDGVEDQAGLGTGGVCTPMCNQLLTGAVLCPTHGQDCSERSGLRIWKEQYLGQGAHVQPRCPPCPTTEYCPSPRGR